MGKEKPRTYKTGPRYTSLVGKAPPSKLQSVLAGSGKRR
jgi:hypothetical protein